MNTNGKSKKEKSISESGFLENVKKPESRMIKKKYTRFKLLKTNKSLYITTDFTNVKES